MSVSLIYTQTVFHHGPQGETQTPPPAYKAARARRYALRATAGRLCGGRIAACGVAKTDADVQIWRAAAEGGRAEFRGLTTCGSIWACPVCAAKIAQRRAEDVAALMAAHETAVYADHGRTGACVYFATLTVSHSPWDRPKALRAGVVAAWRRVQAGKGWGMIKSRAGIVGTVRALEVTHGASGWHPHLHLLIFLARPLTDEDAARLKADLFDRWQSAASNEGATAGAGGFDFRAAYGASGAAAYVAKWGAGCEIAHAGRKHGREGRRNPWQLLEAYRKGDRGAGEAFRDYFRAFRGGRHLTYSRGLREGYGLRDPITDDDAAAQGELDVDDPREARLCASIPAGTWREICRRTSRDGAPLAHELLVAAEIGGRAAVLAVLRRERLDEIRPDTEPRPYRPPRQPTAGEAETRWMADLANKLPNFWDRWNHPDLSKFKGRR